MEIESGGCGKGSGRIGWVTEDCRIAGGEGLGHLWGWDGVRARRGRTLRWGRVGLVHKQELLAREKLGVGLFGT